MKFEDYMIYIIENYVNNEINCINEDIEIEKYKYHYDTRGQEEDLLFLEDLTIEDYNNIYREIEDNTDLIDTINETIQEYLYKYKNEKGAKNE